MTRIIECKGIAINVQLGSFQDVIISHADSQLLWSVRSPKVNSWIVQTPRSEKVSYSTLNEAVKAFADYVQKNESLVKVQRATEERISKSIQSLPTEC